MTFSREQTVGQTQRIGSIEDLTRVRGFLATAREEGAKCVSRCWNGHVGSVTRQGRGSRLQDLRVLALSRCAPVAAVGKREATDHRPPKVGRCVRSCTNWARKAATAGPYEGIRCV